MREYFLRLQHKVRIQFIIIDSRLNVDLYRLRQNLLNYIIPQIPEDELVSQEKLDKSRKNNYCQNYYPPLNVIMTSDPFSYIIRMPSKRASSYNFIFLMRDSQYNDFIERNYKEGFSYSIITGDLNTQEAELFIKKEIKL